MGRVSPNLVSKCHPVHGLSVTLHHRPAPFLHQNKLMILLLIVRWLQRRRGRRLRRHLVLLSLYHQVPSLSVFCLLLLKVVRNLRQPIIKPLLLSHDLLCLPKCQLCRDLHHHPNQVGHKWWGVGMASLTRASSLSSTPL